MSEQQLKEFKIALLKDFIEFYVPEITTDWRGQRLVREAEIQIMNFDWVKLFTAELLNSRLTATKGEPPPSEGGKQ